MSWEEPETEGSICITVLKVNNYTSIRNLEDGVFVFLLSEGSTIVIKDHHQKQLGGERVCFALLLPEEVCCSLACSPWLTQAFLQNPGPTAQRWHHPQWPGASYINH